MSEAAASPPLVTPEDSAAAVVAPGLAPCAPAGSEGEGIRERPLSVPDLAATVRTGGPAAGSAVACSPLFLSVFLLLTGFFVLLLAMSEFDRERTKRVLRSLERQFATATTVTTSRLPVGEDRPSARDAGEETRRDLLFGPPLTAKARRAGIVGRIELPGPRLFDAAGEIRRARWLLFGRMAAATRDPRGWLVEIAAPAPTANGTARLAGRLRAVLALLDRLGADRKAVRYGLLTTTGGQWSFTVRERDGEPVE